MLYPIQPVQKRNELNGSSMNLWSVTLIFLQADNCPNFPNTGQENKDGDEFGDDCDNDK